MQGMDVSHAGPKRRRLQQDRSLEAELKNGNLSNRILERKLLEHVEAVDANMVRSRFTQLLTVAVCRVRDVYLTACITYLSLLVMCVHSCLGPSSMVTSEGLRH
jgi:hypothetical protein